MINPKPELDGSNFTIPKIFLNLTVEDVSMALTPHQYGDIVRLINNLGTAKQNMEDVRKYVTLYKSKLTQQKKDQKLEKSLEDLEEILRQSTIAAARQFAENEVQVTCLFFNVLIS